ncbi:Tfp pilus assembly protein PilX [Paraburkholderia bannensis]|uniref:Tfp pilus assembly protein PilX n=1 Tax=Paraburkholderia bannensis TaxID=765414 RepID=A0A7W9TSW6_9BURK|nr:MULTISPECIES: pilus assembly PilX N-terminal domain-containing protein [Paraburkholderia]MBB3255364.1 Tfp pilus assembly protein PilX [Paraburkholderia sp. WP4_3_2]MBB6100624.1 Tfp pilus assembly protein PilX [Paraburkholderia bannensis]
MRYVATCRKAGRGIALPVVLLLVSMMLVTSAAWFEASLFEARNAAAVLDELQSFHAADGALMLCSRALVDASASASPAAASVGEPQQWRRQEAFEALATTPASSWPGSVRPPQCLAQTWRIETRPAVRAWLVTARGFGATEDAQSWLQMQIVLDGTRIERHWRRVVARPF